MEKQNGAQGYKAHVLVLPYPAQGHINPMLQFSKRLAAKGVIVTLATTIYVAKSMHANPQSSIEVETISDGYDLGGIALAESPEVYLKSLKEVGSRTLASLIKKLEDLGRPINALVYDAFFPWALVIAKQFGVPGFAFFTQTCAVNNVYYHINKGLLKVPPSEPCVSLPSLPKLGLSEVPSFICDPNEYRAFYDMVVGQFTNVDEADIVIFNHFYDLEKEEVDWFAKLWKVKTVGPTIPSMYLDKRLQDDKNYGINLFEPKTATCMKWLDERKKGSVLYISFGSWSEVTQEQMEEIAWGLKNSNHDFLWVVRATEESKLPKNYREEVSEKGLIVTWCPQLDVLSHDSVGCFMTHCGFNSVLEALSIGVPLVAMPIWTDQPTNAKYIEEVWGTGVRARKADKNGIVRREMIETCIKEVMEGEKGEEIKQNAAKWRDLAKQAVDEGGSSDKDIEDLVATLVSSS